MAVRLPLVADAAVMLNPVVAGSVTNSKLDIDTALPKVAWADVTVRAVVGLPNVTVRVASFRLASVSVPRLEASVVRV